MSVENFCKYGQLDSEMFVCLVCFNWMKKSLFTIRSQLTFRSQDLV